MKTTPPLHAPTKISELECRIESIPEYGMKVPVVIYANENLLQKMIFRYLIGMLDFLI